MEILKIIKLFVMKHVCKLNKDLVKENVYWNKLDYLYLSNRINKCCLFNSIFLFKYIIYSFIHIILIIKNIKTQINKFFIRSISYIWF